jgi:hypothetical protein
MRAFRTLSAIAAAATIALSFTALPVAAQTDPGQFVSAPRGTVTVYQRVSTGSYGTYEGPVRWVMGQRDWNGRAVMSATSERHGIQLMDPKNHGLVAQLTSAGAPMYTFNPEIRYEWPLSVGKTWTSVHEMTTFMPPGVLSMTYTVQVDAYEDVTVPAGTFKAFKLTTRNSFGEVEQIWTVPSLGLSTLKVIRDRPATHPLGAGHLEGQLTSRTVPAN